ncbi:PadR family transcriptional regulator [Phycicoccus sp. Root563]|uniref:PadR family transcriptional regulator n=1 Tax=Phycicoccus sp. Root563 TaxID=1736562 RepID=UPI0007025BB4|nr:PadR family transcriptional regulator [Phycicoccus sp. Root563]KQZ89882.1 PadR family transcriptional regulator [Phycicoccus sp. Root563]
MAARRTELLEFAVLGLLHEAPQHGYELRKRLNAALGPFRALSYGTLYPCLRSLLGKGWISEATLGRSTTTGTAGSRRARIVYELTADGKERFQDLLREAGPTAWEDDTFDVHFAFFARTEAEVRLRILEGRRSRLEERLENIRAVSAKNRERFDSYTAELERHGLDSAEREVRWLNELITAERNTPTAAATPAALPATPSSTTQNDQPSTPFNHKE